MNPSPNIPRLSSARMYAGTVLIEGTKLSEGRGTTRALELIGSPYIDGKKVVEAVHKMIPQYLKNVILRPCFFEPTFQKHKGQLCSGLQIHIDNNRYQHEKFKPYRIVAAVLKSVRQLYPDYDLWLPPPYEYEKIKMPIDILSGNNKLRDWVDDKNACFADFDHSLKHDERLWQKQSRDFHIY